MKRRTRSQHPIECYGSSGLFYSYDKSLGCSLGMFLFIFALQVLAPVRSKPGFSGLPSCLVSLFCFGGRLLLFFGVCVCEIRAGKRPIFDTPFLLVLGFFLCFVFVVPSSSLPLPLCICCGCFSTTTRPIPLCEFQTLS